MCERKKWGIMGKTRDPLSLRVHPELLSLFQKEIEQGHDIQAVTQEYLEADLVVTEPTYGKFGKIVLWNEAKRRHKMKQKAS